MPAIPFEGLARVDARSEHVPPDDAPDTTSEAGQSKGTTDMTRDIETRTIEIRPGEGGEDARLFAAELAEAYRRLFAGLG